MRSSSLKNSALAACFTLTSIVACGAGFGWLRDSRPQLVAIASSDAGADAGSVDADAGAPDSGVYSAIATSFDGINEYAQTAASATEFSGLTKFTVSVWAKSRGWNQGALLSRYSTVSSGRNWLLEANANHGLRILICSSGASCSTSWTSANSVLTDGVWTHIVFVYDGTQSTNATKLRTWINGSEVTAGGSYAGTIPTALGTVTQPLWLGAYFGGANITHYGLIDEPAIWTAIAATPTQIADLYSSGRTFNLTTSLLGTPTHWYRLGEGDSTSFVNSGSTASRDLVFTAIASTYNFTSDVRNGTAVTRVRLFALGDSLTVGAQSTDGKGYRSILRAAVTATPLATGPLDFVGPVSDDPIDHFAANGRPIVYYTTGTNLTDQIGSGTRRAHPDVVVFMAGTNDCIDNGTTYNGTTTPAAWASVLETFRTTEPQAKIIALKVPSFPTGSSYVTFQTNVDDLNSKLPALVTTQQGLGQTVALIETMTGVVDGDYSVDGLHFNDSGYTKLEAKIEAQLRTFYP